MVTVAVGAGSESAMGTRRSHVCPRLACGRHASCSSLHSVKRERAGAPLHSW